MTQEQIEKAAGEISYHPFIEIERQGFIRGAQWCINSVWHDKSVRPGEDCDVFVETKRGIDLDRYDTDYNELDSGTDWETEVLRWAYASDLLPERKEEVG